MLLSSRSCKLNCKPRSNVTSCSAYNFDVVTQPRRYRPNHRAIAYAQKSKNPAMHASSLEYIYNAALRPRPLKFEGSRSAWCSGYLIIIEAGSGGTFIYIAAAASVTPVTRTAASNRQ